jgi:hypothetical protein
MSEDDTRKSTSPDVELHQRPSGFGFYLRILEIIVPHAVFSIVSISLLALVTWVLAKIIGLFCAGLPPLEKVILEDVKHVGFFADCALALVIILFVSSNAIKEVHSSLLVSDPSVNYIKVKVSELLERKLFLRAIRDFLLASVGGIAIASLLLYGQLRSVPGSLAPKTVTAAPPLPMAPPGGLRRVPQLSRPVELARPSIVASLPTKPAPSIVSPRVETVGGSDSRPRPSSSRSVKISNTSISQPAKGSDLAGVTPSKPLSEKVPEERSEDSDGRYKLQSESSIPDLPGSLDQSSLKPMEPAEPGISSGSPGSGSALPTAQGNQEPEITVVGDTIQVLSERDIIGGVSFGSLPSNFESLSNKRVTVLVDFDTSGRAKVKGGWDFEKGIPDSANVRGWLKERVRYYFENSIWKSALTGKKNVWVNVFLPVAK